ncbi:TPR end-of-group domain-containing protein, partial [Poseidonibacter sp.]
LRENKDKALQYLENSLKNNEIKPLFVLEDEDWDNYKNDSDFLELIKKY